MHWVGELWGQFRGSLCGEAEGVQTGSGGNSGSAFVERRGGFGGPEGFMGAFPEVLVWRA